MKKHSRLRGPYRVAFGCALLATIGCLILWYVNSADDERIHLVRVRGFEMSLFTKARSSVDPYGVYIDFRHAGRSEVQHLGKHTDWFDFKSVVLGDGEIVILYERHHPEVIVAAYDLQTGDQWPWWNASAYELATQAKKRLQDRIDSFVGQNAPSLGELQY